MVHPGNHLELLDLPGKKLFRLHSYLHLFQRVRNVKISNTSVNNMQILRYLYVWSLKEIFSADVF